MARIRINLRQRIFFSMILLIIISFLSTGVFSFYHFKKENSEYHEDRLQRKKRTITESIDYFLSGSDVGPQTDSLVVMFTDKICELASINNIDVNIYSLGGKFLISSNPGLFEANILEEQLSGSILAALENQPTQVLVKSQSDSLVYLSTYNYLTNYQNKPIAIVNLPYFDSTEIHRQDLNDFLMRLLLIYVLLFLISMLIAFFLSNYITGSLAAIGNKMKNVRISEQNPSLHWRFDDEIGTLVDEYNRMLNELEKSAVKLARTERESAWKEMAKQVAHEIKNPLTPMRLYVQHLERSLQTGEPEKLHEFTRSMISQIDTLGSIAEAFSRFANMPELRMERFPARQIIERVTALYPDNKIQFICDEPETEIYGDRDQLVRVMNNLINNSIQAIPDHLEPEIRVHLSRVKDEVKISVTDNGVGIPASQADKIFEPRFTTKTGGMGLGLAMVKNIVDGFHGKIWFESNPGKGTTFHISLPLAK